MSKQKILQVGLFVLSVILATPVGAKEITPQMAQVAVQRLQAFLNHLKTMEADFSQVVRNPELGIPKESGGLFSARRPGQFRWDYETPFKQTILSDGAALIFYEPDLLQVTRTSASRLEETPAAFFVTDKPLEQLFTWQVTLDEALNFPAIRLKPLTKEGGVREIEIVLHPTEDTILKLVILDSLGHISDFAFTQVRINKPLPNDRFVFQIPPGVDVVTDPKPKKKQ